MLRINNWSRICRLRIGRSPSVTALLLCCLVGLGMFSARTTRSDSGEARSPKTETMPALRGEEAIEHLKEQGIYGSLQEAMAAVRYQAQWQTSPRLQGVGPSYEFKNANNNLLAYVTSEGLEVTSLGETPKAWRLGLRFKDYGYGEDHSLATPGEVTAENNRVSI